MRFFLLLTLLSFSITLFGTTTTNKIAPQPASSAKSKDDARSKLSDMDDDFEKDFDAETDEEALQKLKKKSADKRKESDDKKKEEGKEDQIVNRDKKEDVKKDEEKKDQGLKDTKVNNDENSNFEDDGYEQPEENKELEDQYGDNDVNTLRKAITIGGGYDGSVDYHPSKHLGIEGIMYNIPETGYWIHGISVGLGVVNLDDIAEPYASVAYSGLFMPMSVNWGPFLRIDLGLLGWEYSNDNDNEGVVIVEDEQDDSFAYVGVMVKAGGGFLIGGKSGSGLSVQLLYTMHMTTIGKNDGVEFQVGFHF